MSNQKDYTAQIAALKTTTQGIDPTQMTHSELGVSQQYSRKLYDSPAARKNSTIRNLEPRKQFKLRKVFCIDRRKPQELSIKAKLLIARHKQITLMQPKCT